MKLHYQMYTPEDYEYDKNEIIKLAENNIKSKNVKNIYNKLWNIDTWDVCFSSFYGFPSKNGLPVSSHQRFLHQLQTHYRMNHIH